MSIARAASPHPSRRRALLVGTLSLSVAMVGPPVAGAVVSTSPPSISARHVVLHEPSRIELARARLEFSSAGLRVRQQGADGMMELVRDFAGKRLWLIDRERSVVHEVPLENALHEVVTTVGVGRGLMAGVPCAGRENRLEGQGSWRGQAVELWRCLDSRGATESVEMFGLEWHLVVRVSTPDGRVEELRDIRARDYGPAHFHPAARLREVDKLEFFFGAPEIGLFDDRAATPGAAEGARP